MKRTGLCVQSDTQDEVRWEARTHPQSVAHDQRTSQLEVSTFAMAAAAVLLSCWSMLTACQMSPRRHPGMLTSRPCTPVDSQSE